MNRLSLGQVSGLILDMICKNSLKFFIYIIFSYTDNLSIAY